MTFPTGHLPDAPAVVATRVGMHLHPRLGAAFRAPAVASYPMATRNRFCLARNTGGPGILNQTDTSTCEGHGWALMIWLWFALQNKPIPLPSPVGFYYGALLVSNLPNADGTLPPLRDQGTTPGAILQALALWGLCSADTWGQYPANSSTLLTDPSDLSSPMVPVKPEKLFAESSFRLKGGYFLTSRGNQRLLDLIGVLASGEVLTNAIPASGPTFQRYRGGILGRVEGGVDHCNTVVDYAWLGTQAQWIQWLAALAQNNQSVVASLSQFFLVYGANSWGEDGWGESDIPSINGGLYRAGTDFVDQMEDLAVADLEAA